MKYPKELTPHLAANYNLNQMSRGAEPIHEAKLQHAFALKTPKTKFEQPTPEKVGSPWVTMGGKK